MRSYPHTSSTFVDLLFNASASMMIRHQVHCLHAGDYNRRACCQDNSHATLTLMTLTLCIPRSPPLVHQLPCLVCRDMEDETLACGVLTRERYPLQVCLYNCAKLQITRCASIKMKCLLMQHTANTSRVLRKTLCSLARDSRTSQINKQESRHALDLNYMRTTPVAVGRSKRYITSTHDSK